MSMLVGYRNALATYGATLITHIALVDETDTEISGGSYARKAITWTTASDGTIRPSANLVFEIPASTTVAGWRGYTALTGGTNYGGQTLANVTFSSADQYTLLADDTGILHKLP